MPMPFVQLVIGPPGSGKSTYCDGMIQFLTAIGRPCAVVNLDPANEHPSYGAADIDIRDVITLEDVMEEEHLGPNGGMLYALEAVEHNFDWLEGNMSRLGDEGKYILVDCPGQVELYTYHNSIRNIFRRLEKRGFRLVVVHLIDCYVITRPSLYISSLLLALRSMLQMELPHVNVMTKLDNLANYPPLPFNLDFYTEVQDLQYLIPHLAKEPHLFPGSNRTRGQRGRREEDQYAVQSDEQIVESINQDDDDDFDPDDPAFRNTPRGRLVRLTSAIARLVDDFSLLSFHTLAIEDRTSVAALVRAIDVATGYVFVPSIESLSRTDGAGQSGMRDPRAPNEAALWSTAMQDPSLNLDVRDVQERWIDRREELDEVERRRWEAEAGVVPPNPENEKKIDMWNSQAGQSNGAVDDIDWDDDSQVQAAIEAARRQGVSTADGRRVNGVTVVRKPASGSKQ